MQENKYDDRPRLDVVEISLAPDMLPLLPGRAKDLSAPGTVKRRKDNWIGRILCKNYIITHDIKGKIEWILGLYCI